MPKKLVDTKTYFLMHKDTLVAELDMIEDTATIANITIANIEFAPVATATKHGTIDKKELNAWLQGRSIPASRQHISEILGTLGVMNTQTLSLSSYGLGLNDQYWFKPEGITKTWKEVNYFENQFSNDMGDVLLLEKSPSDKSLDLRSPDNSSDGWLKKRWYQKDEYQYLLKGGSGSRQQEPYNEEIASKLLTELGIAHVRYEQVDINEQPYSLCRNFITTDTEYVPASRLQKAFKHPGNISNYEHLINCCQEIRIQNSVDFLNKMLAFDYLIANTDRHWFNFGFIRNSNTLEYIGFAPLFDNGTSLWHENHSTEQDLMAKTFGPEKGNTHSQQLKFITDLSWFNPVSKEKITEIVTDVLGRNNRVDAKHITMIIDGIIAKSDVLVKLQKELTK